MKIVIVPTIEEQLQAGRSEDILDPAGVKTGDYPLPLLMGYNYAPIDKMTVGHISNIRLEDGRLVGDVDLEVGWAGVVDKEHVEGGVRTVDSLRLIHASFVRMPARPS